MIAFHGDLKIKDKYLNRVLAHAEADQIIKGLYWKNGKGCAVGCTIHSADHAEYETQLGIPRWLAKIEDRLFEGMSDKDSKIWPENFLAAIHPGADLEKAKAPFMIYLMKHVLKNFDNVKYPKVVSSINEVIRLYETNGTIEDFRKTYSAAADAAATADAAYAYAYAYADAATTATAAHAAAAAAAAAYAAADDAAAAAYAAAAAVGAYAGAAYAYAGADAYLEIGDELLKILSHIKP